MNLLTTLVRTLGNERAVSNAEVAASASAHDDRLVQALAHRLDQHDASRSRDARPEATTTAA